jgi:2-oxoisovalerate dehydrogenase E1 component alpha subunit
MSPTLLRRIYRVSVLTRLVDERLWILARQGRAGFVLTARGHEVAQVASTAAMRRGHDSAWPYYRDMGVGLALGVTPYEILLGALARAADPHSGGRQLTMHLSSPSLRIGSISSGIAAHLPHAVGAAYAARVRGDDSVAVCWFGDGAASEGATHEAMNLAAVHRLPVVFICENNGIAISVPLALQMPVERVSDRAAAYAMPGVSVDGTDAEAVYAVSRTAVERARGGEGPSLLELRVPRITPHSSQDDDAYRTDEQRAAAAAADPLPRLRETLVERGLLSLDDDERMVREAREQVVADEDLALAMPEPPPERARRWLHAGDPPHDGAVLPPRYAGWKGVFGD